MIEMTDKLCLGVCLFINFHPEDWCFFLPYHMSKQIDRPLQGIYSAHFAFTLGKFCGSSHDPLLYFHGEEISIAARAFTWGYSLFHPHGVMHGMNTLERVEQNIGMTTNNGLNKTRAL